MKNSPLRILHVVPALTKGGAERVAVDLANTSSRLGHEVHVMALWRVSDVILRQRLDESVEVHYILPTRPPRFLGLLFSIVWTMANLRFFLQKEVIHVHLTQPSILGSFIFVAVRILGRKTPIVLETYHAVGMDISRVFRLIHMFNFWMRDAISFMALDSFWEPRLKLFNRATIRVIRNGVDSPRGKAPTANTEPYLKSLGIRNRRAVVFGSVGQLRPDRRPLTLAKVFIEVLRSTPNHVMGVFFGGGPEMEKVKNLISAHGLEGRFLLPGEVMDPHAAISCLDLHVPLNVGSVTGIAALEAGFAGVPQVGLQLDDEARRLDEEWVWSTPSEEDLVQAILGLLSNARERKNLGLAQSQRCERDFSASRMTEDYISLYRETLGVGWRNLG